MSDEIILFDELIDLLKKKVIGRSVSYNCGWIKAEDIYTIAEDIKNGKIDKFGNKIEE